MKNDLKIFSGSASITLTQKIVKYLDIKQGKSSLQIFSDGEFCPSFDESVRGKDIFLVQSTYAPAENIIELLLMIDAAKRASANHITAVIPYFGFARQDRKDQPRVPIGAKVMADLLQATGVNRVITMDLHAGQIQGFFNIPVDHLTGSDIFVPYIIKMRLNKIKNLTFASADSGGTKNIRKYANYFGVDFIICDKFRKKANKVEDIRIVGEPKGKNILLIDDLVDTAGTLCLDTEALIQKGAESVRVLCTHPVMSGKAYERIQDSQMLELITTDTIPLKNESPKIKVLSSGQLFGSAIEKIYSNKSLNECFILK